MFAHGRYGTEILRKRGAPEPGGLIIRLLRHQHVGVAAVEGDGEGAVLNLRARRTVRNAGEAVGRGGTAAAPTGARAGGRGVARTVTQVEGLNVLQRVVPSE